MRERRSTQLEMSEMLTEIKLLIDFVYPKEYPTEILDIIEELDNLYYKSFRSVINKREEEWNKQNQPRTPIR